MFGFLNVDKPPGPTSHDVVARIRRMLPRKTRVGHAGTLDPFAQGVLVVCVGHATRLADLVQGTAKGYRAEVTLGATSTTDDPEGALQEMPAAADPGPAAVEAAAGRFVGVIQQVPPAHSAVHVQGRRAYELARAGQSMSLAPREVRIDAIEILSYDWPRAMLEIRCGSGTYIRSLARDIGATLGVGGYCSALRRIQVGPFVDADAVPLDAIDPATHLLPPDRALGEMPRATVDVDQVRRILMGQAIEMQASLPPGTAAAIAPGDRLLALCLVSADGRTLQPQKVFPPAD